MAYSYWLIADGFVVETSWITFVRKLKIVFLYELELYN